MRAFFSIPLNSLLLLICNAFAISFIFGQNQNEKREIKSLFYCFVLKQTVHNTLLNFSCSFQIRIVLNSLFVECQGDVQIVVFHLIVIGGMWMCRNVYTMSVFVPVPVSI